MKVRTSKYRDAEEIPSALLAVAILINCGSLTMAEPNTMPNPKILLIISRTHAGSKLKDLNYSIHSNGSDVTAAAVAYAIKSEIRYHVIYYTIEMILLKVVD